MIFARRLIHVIAWAGTLAVALIALALIVSQTPWFRDWIRVAIIREAREYLNGELTIGRIDGNLFFGIRLSDVAVNVSDDRAIAVKTLAVEYSIARLLSRGTVIDSITMTSPVIRASRDAEGWNIGDLIKPRREPARDEPLWPLSLSYIVLIVGMVFFV
jgi:uncharacterized protein involved in outer membrane biogenesis